MKQYMILKVDSFFLNKSVRHEPHVLSTSMMIFKLLAFSVNVTHNLISNRIQERFKVIGKATNEGSEIIDHPRYFYNKVLKFGT